MFKKIITLKVGQIVLGGFLVAALAGAAAFATTVVTVRSGASAGFQYVEAYDSDWLDEVCATSTSWADMPNMSRTFTQGGLLMSDPVLVTLNAELSGLGYIRVLVDGQEQSGSAASAYIPGGDGTSYTRNFATNSVNSGQHTIKLQWRLSGENDMLCTRNLSMTIFHRITL